MIEARFKPLTGYAPDPSSHEDQVMLPTVIPGPLALDLPGGDHEWATWIRFEEGDGETWLDWHGGHHHRNRLTGPPLCVASALHVPTQELGTVVLRPIGPADTWKVFPANLSAWEAYRRGLL
jgi:hypothetical protein